MEITKTLSTFASASDVCQKLEEFREGMKKSASSTEGVNASFQPSNQKEDRIFDGLYAWHCYNRSKSKSELANYLSTEGFRAEAYKIYPYGMSFFITIYIL